MRILIVGGTSFVGRAVAWAALNAGHDVTVINRGQTPTDLPATVTRLIGDRSQDLGALTPLNFDVTVDAIAYRPNDVARLRDAIGQRGGHHIQISSVSAYQSPRSWTTETTALLWDAVPDDPDAPITAENYGPFKAACERSAQALFGDRLTIVRPTYVIGAHDATMRFPYWVERLRRGGNVAVPGPRTNLLQYVDARNLGEFVVHLAELGQFGEFHVANPFPAPRYLDVIEAIAQRVAPAQTKLIEVSPEQLMRHHLETRFPLWAGAHGDPNLAVDPEKAVTAGLRFRDLDDSVDDVTAWWNNRDWPTWWLTREQEAMLVREAALPGGRPRPRLTP